MTTDEQLRELMARVVAGDQLSMDEESKLIQSLAGSPRLRDEFLADQAMANLLGCVAHLEDVDNFVSATMDRVVDSDQKLLIEAPPIATVESPPVQSIPRAYVPSTPRPRRSVLRQVLPALAGCLLATMAMTAVFYLLSDGNQVTQAPIRPSTGDSDPPLPELPRPGFAELVNIGAAVWRHARDGDRLAAGRLELLRGESEIRFDSGTIARLAEPTVLELNSVGEVFLSQGTLNVKVPQQAVGFMVATPVGRVIDLGTEFDVAVGESGRTETHVREGKVVFAPQRNGEVPGRPVELTPTTLDRVVASVPNVSAPVLPVSSVVSGKQGQFVGSISVNGQTVQFESREEFERYQQQVFTQLNEAPHDFSDQWSIMFESSSSSSSDGASFSGGASSGSKFSGGASFSGGSAGMDAPDARQMLREQLRQMRDGHPGNAQINELLDELMRQMDESP